MKKNLALLVLFTLFCLPLAGSVTINLPDNPGKFEKIAEAELREFLAQILDCPISVSLVRDDTLENEAWQLDCAGDRAIINGGKNIGILFGAYEFLESLGLRFLAPDEVVLPAKKIMQVPLIKASGTPSYSFERSIYNKLAANLWLRGASTEVINAYRRWELRLRGGSAHGRLPALQAEYRTTGARLTDKVSPTHNFLYYVNRDKYADSHPEYFSMDKTGKRNLGRPKNLSGYTNLCVTNPEVIAITVESMLQFIAEDREKLPREDWPEMYELNPSDGIGYICECPECSKVSQKDGNIGLLIAYINAVAAKVAEKYPDVKVQTLAYGDYRTIVNEQLQVNDNVFVKYCKSYLRSDCYRPVTHPVNSEMFALFNNFHRVVGKQSTLWLYGNMGGSSYFSPPRIETGIDALAADLKYFQQKGVRGIFIEYELDELKPQMFFLLDNYVSFKLMNKIDDDPEKLIDEFIFGYYGPAASEMKIIHDSIRKGVAAEKTPQHSMKVKPWTFVTRNYLEWLKGQFEEAERKTAGTRYLARVHREMIVPYWVMVAQGLDIDKEKCRAITMHELMSGGSDVKKARRFPSTAELDGLLAEIPFPEGFDPSTSKVFAYPHTYGRENAPDGRHVYKRHDPDSKVEKVMLVPENNTHAFTYKNCRWLLCSSDLKSQFWPRMEIVPENEKYAWYVYRNVKFSGKTWMTEHSGSTRIDLSSAWSPPDGEERPEDNCFDVWFSLKLTCPHYHKDSDKPNGIFLEYVVLTAPGAVETMPVMGRIKEK